MAVGGDSGYETSLFLKVPDFQCECSICTLILRKPQQVECCGERFCKVCIGEIAHSKNPCPKCRKGIQYFPDKKCEQDLNKVQVKCLNHEHGCKWTGELYGLGRHLNLKPDSAHLYNGCEVVLLKCPYCSKDFKRVDLKHHKTQRCNSRPYNCDFCKKYSATYKEVKNHHRTCVDFIISCPKCSATFSRKDKRGHLDTCPLVEVACEYSYAGCDTRVLRKDLSAHLVEVDHNKILIKHLEGKIADLETENSKLHCVNASSSLAIDQLRSECKDLTDSLQIKMTEKESLEEKCTSLSSLLQTEKVSAEVRCISLTELLEKTQMERDESIKTCVILKRDLNGTFKISLDTLWTIMNRMATIVENVFTHLGNNACMVFLVLWTIVILANVADVIRLYLYKF